MRSRIHRLFARKVRPSGQASPAIPGAPGATADPDHVVELVFSEALPAARQFATDVAQQTVDAFRALGNRSGARYIFTASIDGTRALLHHNLHRISRTPGFKYFSVTAMQSGEAVRIAGFFPNYWVPVYINRLQDGCIVVGDADFVNLPGPDKRNDIKPTETHYVDDQSRARDLLLRKGARFHCSLCGIDWPVWQCAGLDVRDGGDVFFMCPSCKVLQLAALD